MTRSARRRFTDDFKREAVRLTQTSGRTIKQVADDLGIGPSTLTRWRQKHIEADLLSGPHDDVEKDWTCPAKVPDTYLIYTATVSNARGLFPPSVECLRRGL